MKEEDKDSHKVIFAHLNGLAQLFIDFVNSYRLSMKTYSASSLKAARVTVEL